MDVRIGLVRQEGRIRPVTQEDLPTLSKAIALCVLGLGKATQKVCYGADIIQLYGVGISVSVLREDWEKILPYLKDGSWNPQVVPHLFRRDSKVLAEEIALTLKPIFPASFPTSNY